MARGLKRPSVAVGKARAKAGLLDLLVAVGHSA